MVTVSDWMDQRPWLDLDKPDVRAYVDGLSSRSGFDLAAALERWRDDGLVIFEGVVDTRLIDALVSDVEYLRKHYMDFAIEVELLGDQGDIKRLSPEDLESPGVKFNSIHTISMAAARLSLTKELVEFLTHVFGGPPCALQSLTFYRGSQQPIHVDYPYVRCQSPLSHLAASWIPLEDVHPDSGPLAYYPGSHRIDKSGMFDWGGGSILFEPDSPRQPNELSEYLQQRMEAVGIAPRVFCPKKGDALIWHGNLSHAGSAIANPELTRKSYVTHYTSLHAYPKHHMKPGAPETGSIYSANGGHVLEYSWLDQPRQLPSSFQPA
ncbi:MAG: phytanoyl-CoA dioxygenase family protein [Betaproteobacteria bacterium]